MTSIAAASPALSQAGAVARAVAATAMAGATSSVPSIPSAAPPSPAVVISISPGTLPAAAHPGDKTAEQRVNSLVEAVSSHNEMADLLAHIDWEAVAAVVGKEKAAATKAEFDKANSYSVSYISRQFSESGIDVRPVTNEQATTTGLAPGTLQVKDFTFKSGGSVYAVTAREDGTLVGTRDGEAWKTWKTILAHAAPAATGADAALATLQGILSSSDSVAPIGSLGLLSMSV